MSLPVSDPEEGKGYTPSTVKIVTKIMSWGKLLDLLSFSVFSIFSLWIGIVFLQETVDSIPCP